MDFDLEELQKLFEQTQNAKAKVRLSERNVVELVSKLQELQLLDNDLLHTVSGKEYITQVRITPFCMSSGFCNDCWSISRLKSWKILSFLVKAFLYRILQPCSCNCSCSVLNAVIAVR
jgi:hypothetical protein